VRLDTGEIMRVFMRKKDYQAYPGDTVALAHRMTDTPLDSPMTGTPIVYPGDVGTDATKVFVGDADGTVWRFDLSSPDPTQWVGELYLDLYNSTVDTGSTAWSDGQQLEVTPVVSLDTAGELVMNIATGTTETYNNSGLEYVYSVTEKVQVQGTTSKLRAFVNWWLGPPTFQAGERVSGPMTVFNGTLYFSTYAAAPPGTAVCAGGLARLWGRDFVTPDQTSDLSQGGLREMQPPPPNPPQTPAPVYIQPSDYDPTLLGKVIPGVSIKATPACAGLGTGVSDSYVPGATHQAPQNYSPGGYSLFTQVGAKSTSGAGGARTFETTVPTPVAPTVIDSWAAVLD
jgi:type IV pilus assembly protein PilY1